DISGTQFLVDTGACHSTFPAVGSKRCQQEDVGVKFVAANSSSIEAYGFKTLQSSFTRQQYSQTFILAKV
ncbi:hypothetical protein SK128_005406, partial [Halocaridina rubra]